MRSMRCTRSKGLFAVVTFWTMLLLAGCGTGSDSGLTDTVDTVDDRNISGIAGPSDPSQLEPAARVPRDQFAVNNTTEALAYPGLNSGERTAFERSLQFFITDRTSQNGLGPIFNQRICLGCHRSSDDIATLSQAEMSGAGLATISTPASRASRFGPTDHALLNGDILAAIDARDPSIGQDEGRGKPATAAFTLFGAFFPAAGSFNPETAFGGPIQHVRSTGDCFPDIVPPESIDPFILGGIDPITGQPVIGGRRAVGERAAPPYIGRGLMEAIFSGDIVANEDPGDRIAHRSTLTPAREDLNRNGTLDPEEDLNGNGVLDMGSNPECPGDCISARHNENAPGTAFPALDPVVRVARFGLRAAGPSLIQFMLGGTSQEIGVTSPFALTENNNNQNVGRSCDVAGDPELTADDILDLRRLIRLTSLPELDACILGTSDVCDVEGATRASVENGARLFGVDLVAFRSRLVPGETPIGDPQGINQADQQLNCAGCHIPIARTGESPAEVGARHLSNKWFPLFSDLLIHDMGEIPAGLADPVPQPPFSLDGATFEISRNLADFALPGQGLATGRDWRTPPLMGLGVIGAPFLHDARVYLSNNSERRARTVQSSSDGGTNVPLVVEDLDDAILAAIELHDLPVPPPAAPANTCPVQPGVPFPTEPPAAPNAGNSVCPPPNSANRSEARNVMARWRALSRAEQQDVINFLKGL